MTVIKSVDGLRKYREIINLFFREHGEIYLQSYLSIDAVFRSKGEKEIVAFIEEKDQLLSVFEKKSKKVWQCCFAGYPFLGKTSNEIKIVNFLKQICHKLEVETLYFPLVYKKNDFLTNLLKNKDIYFWERLASPIVKGELSWSKIWERVRLRYGSRAERQRKKFEKELYVEKVSLNEVEKVVKKIEINSWKRMAKQDMLSRGNQFEYYCEIVKSGLAEISAAFDKKTKEAVAFRIDALTKNVLHVLKWSYDDKYGRYSPGFYLLTVDLFKKYSPKNIKYIDLYGSPDKLKDLLENERLERIDFCYSTRLEEIKAIRDERLSFDKKIVNNYEKEKSIKKNFL